MSREIRRVPVGWQHPTEPNPYWRQQTIHALQMFLDAASWAADGSHQDGASRIDDFDLDLFDEDEWVELVLAAVREQWG